MAKKILLKTPAKALNAALAKKPKKAVKVEKEELELESKYEQSDSWPYVRRKTTKSADGGKSDFAQLAEAIMEPAKTKARKKAAEKAVLLDPEKPTAGFPPAVEPTTIVAEPPTAAAEQPAVALPPVEPAAKAKKQRFAAGHKQRTCPGVCKNTGEVDGHPCPVCHPSEYVAEERAKHGACLHQDVGFCPSCDRRAMEREGARGSAKDTPASAFAVFRDYNGVVYLRVAVASKKRKADLYVVNKALSVELVSICYDSARSLYLQPVAGASVYEAARRLFTPLNDQATISVGAKEYLTDILNNKELEMKSTSKTAAATETPTAKNAAPVKRAKFATTDPLPVAAKGKKATADAAPAAKATTKAVKETPAKAAKATKEAPAKATKAVAAKANGKAEAAPAKAGRKGKFTPEMKITVVKEWQKVNPHRQVGGKAHAVHEAYASLKTVGEFYDFVKQKGYPASYLSDDVRDGYITIK